MTPSEILDPLSVALRVARALEAERVGYFLGGSLASSVQGEPRATNDIDFVVDLSPAQVGPLVERLGPDFDVDAEALTEAARLRRSWNIYHLPSMTKVDLFVLGETPYDASEFGRRESVEVRPGEALQIKRPEDSVLRKLLWYRAGGEVSERQWRDVVEVLRVSGPQLDRAYLERWVPRLGLEELWARAQLAAR